MAIFYYIHISYQLTRNIGLDPQLTPLLQRLHKQSNTSSSEPAKSTLYTHIIGELPGTHVILGVFSFDSFERLIGWIQGGTDQPDTEIEGARHAG